MPESISVRQVLDDPMLSKAEFGLRRIFYPLGFGLELETNSADVVGAADDNWGGFLRSFETPPLRLALGVRERAGGAEPFPARSTFLAREHLMSIVMDAENFVTCDFDRGYAFGWITPELAADSALLRYRILTPAAVMMAEALALAPLHGALIVRKGCGVVLCGDSFAGKSTLAYACARQGWTYVSDDGTFLVRERTDRYAIGNPHFIRFREDARELFSELADRLAVARPNGKIGIEVSTAELAIATAPGARIERVVFLNREHSGPARLQRIPKDHLEAWCERYVNFGTDAMRAAMLRCHKNLVEAGAWELSYQNFEEAIRRLEQLVDLGG